MRPVCTEDLNTNSFKYQCIHILKDSPTPTKSFFTPNRYSSTFFSASHSTSRRSSARLHHFLFLPLTTIQCDYSNIYWLLYRLYPLSKCFEFPFFVFCHFCNPFHSPERNRDRERHAKNRLGMTSQ